MPWHSATLNWHQDQVTFLNQLKFSKIVRIHGKASTEIIRVLLLLYKV